jgi:hypothetical protein
LGGTTNQTRHNLHKFSVFSIVAAKGVKADASFRACYMVAMTGQEDPLPFKEISVQVRKIFPSFSPT